MDAAVGRTRSTSEASPAGEKWLLLNSLSVCNDARAVLSGDFCEEASQRCDG